MAHSFISITSAQQQHEFNKGAANSHWVLTKLSPLGEQRSEPNGATQAIANKAAWPIINPVFSSNPVTQLCYDVVPNEKKCLPELTNPVGMVPVLYPPNNGMNNIQQLTTAYPHATWPYVPHGQAPYDRSTNFHSGTTQSININRTRNFVRGTVNKKLLPTFL